MEQKTEEIEKYRLTPNENYRQIEKIEEILLDEGIKPTGKQNWFVDHVTKEYSSNGRGITFMIKYKLFYAKDLVRMIEIDLAKEERERLSSSLEKIGWSR